MWIKHLFYVYIGDCLSATWNNHVFSAKGKKNRRLKQKAAWSIIEWLNKLTIWLNKTTQRPLLLWEKTDRNLSTNLIRGSTEIRYVRLKSHENGRNIVGQQLPKLLDVTCYVRLHTLLHVVGCCRELLRKVWNWATNSQHFLCSVIAEASATMLDPFAQLYQH